ncbi:MAG: mechanosensitive ion channel family protein [Alphaproteobacteria bacterium]|nr:mechanosensitive ion channel family protein [Alphaproteobacteria bacterium]
MARRHVSKLSQMRIFGLILALLVGGSGPLSAQDAADTSAPISLAADQVDVKFRNLQIMIVPLTANELASLAGIWQTHLQKSLIITAELFLLLNTENASNATDTHKLISENRVARQAIIDNYAAVLDGWEAKGATPEELNQHRTYILAVTLNALQLADAYSAFDFAKDWVISWNGGIGVILKLIIFAFAIWVLMLFARITKSATVRSLGKVPTLSRLLKNFISKTVYWISFAIGLIVVLALFGVNVTPLFAVFGGVSFILGFALQDTLGNLASGLMIMLLKPFDTGDFIRVSGTSGIVDDMTVVSTKIRTHDNQVIIVPNSKIWGDVITNVSASAERRVDLVFGISYSDDAKFAIRVLSDLLEAHPKCLPSPEYKVFVGELGDNSVNIFCRPWSKTEDYWVVYWDIMAQAKERFDQEGISIPFPQRDVHIIHENIATEPSI